jgi:hypothetical protein
VGTGGALGAAIPSTGTAFVTCDASGTDAGAAAVTSDGDGSARPTPATTGAAAACTG